MHEKRQCLEHRGIHAKAMVRPKAPFPYFGGKSKVAAKVWKMFGDVDNYVEPFCGSAAVLLARPTPPRIETINDYDNYVANFWRATSQDPEAVAEHADWPVNETDLHSRHRWLVLSDEAKAFRERMRKDPEYFDAKIAGWWCWGLCCWIGGGWCKSDQLDRHQNSPPQLLGDRGVGRKVKEKMPKIGGEHPGQYSGATGVHGKPKKGQLKDSRPRIDGRGRDSETSAVQPGVLGGPPRKSGTNAESERRSAINHVHGRMDGVVKNVDSNGKKPRLTGGRKGDEYFGGLGVHTDSGESGNRPQLADTYSRGRGVHGDDSKGTCQERREWLVKWFHQLRDRLRTVRVCCGDWLRVCDSESVTTRLGITGIFFDPPYSAEAGRDMTLYASESGTVAHDVRRYCLERGGNKMMRIALCGYEGEGHEELEKHGWTVVKWKSSGGYGNRTEKGKANARKERIWFSPHCSAEKRGFFH